jgi:hypothetical protein
LFIPLGTRQLLRPDQPEEQHESPCGADRDQAQQIARAASGEDVDQDECHRGSNHTGQQEVRHQRRQYHDWEQRSTPVDDPIGGEDRHRHQHHHPGRVHQGLAQLGQIEAQPIHRCCHQHVEIPRQEITGQRRDEIGQEQQRREGEKGDAEQFGGQDGADFLLGVDVA